MGTMIFCLNLLSQDFTKYHLPEDRIPVITDERAYSTRSARCVLTSTIRSRGRRMRYVYVSYQTYFFHSELYSAKALRKELTW